MNDVAPLIRRMTEDLRALQKAMQGDQRKPVNSVHEDLLEEMISAQLVEEFKSAIDQTRHFLWCYIEDFAARHDTGSAHVGKRSDRLQCVSEMLRTLSQRAAPMNSKLAETMSFFERIDSVVTERLLTENQAHNPKEDVA